MQRSIAFCCNSWSSDSTIFSWTYAKRYFLRKVQDERGNEVLSDLDTLYIVHVSSSKAKDKDRWDAGGPIMPRLATALANYPHRVVELEGRDTAAAILEFVAKEEIDILILGSREHKGAMTKMGVGSLGSTSDSVKARCKCPCLIIRPSSARHENMRIRSLSNLAALLDGGGRPSHSGLLTTPAEPEPRKVCIAFERAEPGHHMTAWAAKHCLFPDDDIHLLHITNRSPLEKMQKSASFQKAMLKPRMSAESVAAAEEDCDSVGVEELAGYRPPRRVRLRGDAKQELCEYLEAHRIDLLIVGFSAAGRFRKALAGGSLSTYMLHHAPCPLVVLPLKSMAWEEQDTLGNLPELAVSVGSDAAPLFECDGTSPPPLNSLGPRVSINRSLSNQLALMREQRRCSADTATSISPPGAASAVPDSARSHPDTGVLLPTGSAPELDPAVRRPQSSSSYVSPHADGQLPVITSPFQVSSFSRDSAESMDSQGHAVRQSFASAPAAQPQDVQSEIAWLRRQLDERDSRVSSLQEEVRLLKLQLATPQGGPLLSQASGRDV